MPRRSAGIDVRTYVHWWYDRSPKYNRIHTFTQPAVARLLGYRLDRLTRQQEGQDKTVDKVSEWLFDQATRSVPIMQASYLATATSITKMPTVTLP